MTSPLAGGAAEVHLDLAGLTLCDSSGVNAFINAQNAVHNRHAARLVLLKPKPHIHVLFRITGLTSHFDIRQ